MRSYPFLIRTRTPLATDLAVSDLPAASSDRAYIPATSILGTMRHLLRLQTGTARPPSSHEIPLRDEVRLFGDLERSAQVYIQDAKAVTVANERRAFLSFPDQTLWHEELISVDSLFEGLLAFTTTDSSVEMTGLLCLLSINQLGRGRVRGCGSCSVSLDPTTISISKIFAHKPGRAKGKVEWPLLVRQRALAYFADRPDAIYRITPREFEHTIAEVFRLEGFDVEVTPETRDGGYDVLAVRHRSHTDNEFILVECKRYPDHRKVGIDVVRRLFGVVTIENATRGVIVTTSSFSAPAKSMAERIGLTLYDLDTLTDWINNLCSTSKTWWGMTRH